MKIVKFRVWTGIEMEYNVMAGKFGTFYVNPSNNGLDENDKASLTPFNTKYSEDKEPLMFTGQCDKDGEEIYENDIIENEFGKKVVKWEGSGFYCHEKHFPPFPLDYLTFDKVKKIGNLYETPNLLEK